jgi:hypothetical protein
MKRNRTIRRNALKERNGVSNVSKKMVASRPWWRSAIFQQTQAPHQCLKTPVVTDTIEARIDLQVYKKLTLVECFGEPFKAAVTIAKREINEGDILGPPWVGTRLRDVGQNIERFGAPAGKRIGAP